MFGAHCRPYTTNTIFSQASCTRTNKAIDGRQCNVNPLTIVLRNGKAPRICVDARKVNRYTLPDRARVPPIQELLQQFHGSKFITSIDLSSAFLQIGLKKESRKYTSFLFDSQLYQFTRCPYGFRNSQLL